MTESLEPEALKAKGLATLRQALDRLDRGDVEGHEALLAQSGQLLSRAYRAGQKDPEVVWPLKQLWTDTGHLERVIELLKDYLESTANDEERFLAGHYIVDTYALMSERGNPAANLLAVEHHRKYMDELGPAVAPVRQLWSYSDATMMRAWSETGQLDAWVSRSRSVYQRVTPNDEESRRTLAYYLRTLSFVCPGGPRESIECERSICELYRNDASPEGFWLVGNALGRLKALYQEVGEVEQSLAARNQAMELVSLLHDKYESLSKSHDPAAVDYQKNGYRLCHDLGCLFMWDGELEDSIVLFERALEFQENALTRYFYAGVLLKARNDREGALANLKRAASDPRTSLIHRFEQEFLANANFASVHTDPEFLAVVWEAMNRYSGG